MLKPARQNVSRRQVASGASIKPPTGGWDAVSPLASMPEDRAPVLDNWIPRQGYIEVRRGHRIHATGMTQDVSTLMPYNGLTSASSALFSIADGIIYDATNVGAATSTGVTGLSTNEWQHINFTTTAGKYLWCCSGSDDVRHYNGSVWATPTLTGVDSSEIINVNAHKNRIWVVIANSTTAGYLATGAVAGVVTPFELGGLFTKGGYLVAMGTWTRDGGAGSDDLAVFVSSNGQVAVYEGTDPSSASTWSLVGVYDLGPPIGYRCLKKVGADLAILNIDGVLPLSLALSTDRATASKISITANIDRAMNEAARNYKDNFGWELTTYPKGTLVILNVPIAEGETQHQYVMNTLSGAWCRWTGMNANCWATFRDDLYFGGNSGVVYRADVTSADVNDAIDAIGQTAYNYFNARGVFKDFKLIRPLVTTDSSVAPAIGISTDYKDNATLRSPSITGVARALFDSAVWDNDVFPVESRNISDWATVFGSGHCASVHFRVRTKTDNDAVVPATGWGTKLWNEGTWGLDSSGDTGTSEVVVQINGFDTIYEKGGYM